MRVSINWLRQWVDTKSPVADIAQRLTMLGLEVDAIETIDRVPGVVIGQIVACQPHPRADRLKNCDVDIGAGGPLAIVCGAGNAVVGVCAPVAPVGTILPGGREIAAAKIRGIESAGMLCSAAELGLASESEGLWLVDNDIRPGTTLDDYLGLPDQVLAIDLTPNRGDCLSVRGVARELAVIERLEMTPPGWCSPAVRASASPAVHIDAPERCAGYAARYIGGIAAGAGTPVWLRERLRRADIRPINLPVDIGNYVMLELGQPMHAFDGDRLAGDIHVRMAIAGERIETLDGDDVSLSGDTLIIADDRGPLAIAGMIGGTRTAVDASTTNVVFEAACFTPAAVAGQGRRYKIQTDSLHRFERGVDPELYPAALERASALLAQYGRGQAGPTCVTRGQPLRPRDRRIALDAARVERLLGQIIEPAEIEQSLAALGVALRGRGGARWCASPPSWRFDLNIEADLIEEIARVYGYNRLEAGARRVTLPALRAAFAVDDENLWHATLGQRGYNEAITYSFVEPALHRRLIGGADTVAVDNPISDQYAEMRRTLWASLLPSWAYNVRRQQARVRLYEAGLRFIPDPDSEHGIAQIPTLAGVAAGPADDAHWDVAPRPVDLFDIKGDLEALYAGSGVRLTFEAARHPALHPGRSARVRVDDEPAGWLGQLSPEFKDIFKTKDLPYLFEVDSISLKQNAPPGFEPVPEQPAIRRDIAVVVAEKTPAAALVAAVKSVEASSLSAVTVFDVYRGRGLEPGFKSVALGLIFQDKASTLTDDAVDTIINSVVQALYARCDARIRE